MSDDPPAPPRSGPRGGARPITRPDDGRLTRSGHTFEIREGERERVADLARVCTSRQIGLILRGASEPISAKTICHHFADELAWGKANMIASAGGKLVDAVLAGKESSIQFYLRTQGEPGQFVERKEITGRGGGPIQTADLTVLADLPIEKLRALEHAAAILAGDTGHAAGGADSVSDPSGPDSGGD